MNPLVQLFHYLLGFHCRLFPNHRTHFVYHHHHFLQFVHRLVIWAEGYSLVKKCYRLLHFLRHFPIQKTNCDLQHWTLTMLNIEGSQRFCLIKKNQYSFINHLNRTHTIDCGNSSQRFWRILPSINLGCSLSSRANWKKHNIYKIL